jgi:glucosyl-3-phosphoglycerate synthase
MPPARTRESRFTYAVVGRNEAAHLGDMVGLAQQAAEPEDQVWFVDSASEDDSIAVARGLGVDEVIDAPVGKGRAMAVALDRCGSGYICFLDADWFEWTANAPALLRAEALRTGADMVVGVYSDDRRRVIQPYLYWPLVDALFPDYGRVCDPTPLSGMRVIDATLVRKPLPPGYGVETYLNLTFAAAGCKIAIADLGFLRGPLRGYTNVQESAIAVTTEILNFAVLSGRLDAAQRPQWDRWIGHVLSAIGVPPLPGAPDGEHLAAVAAAAARPLPPARATDPVVGELRVR